jgi:hypothetical protein
LAQVTHEKGSCVSRAIVEDHEVVISEIYKAMNSFAPAGTMQSIIYDW